MTRVVHLPPFPATDADALTDVTGDAPGLFWRLVLAVAVRDGATSVHYHPWRTDPTAEETLSYVVGGYRYALVPPDPAPEFVGQLLAAARRLAVRGPVGWLRSWAGGGAVGRLRLVAGSDESEWCVVSWGRGQLAGVEFLRLSPVPVVAPSDSQGT